MRPASTQELESIRRNLRSERQKEVILSNEIQLRKRKFESLKKEAESVERELNVKMAEFKKLESKLVSLQNEEREMGKALEDQKYKAARKTGHGTF